MIRSWLNSVFVFVTLTYGLAATSVFAAPNGNHSHRGNSSRGMGNVQSVGLKQAVSNNRLNNMSSAKVGKASGIGPLMPTGPVVGPRRQPLGPIGPIGPIKPPNGPIVGPFNPPIGPIGPIGPIKPPNGPIVGPFNPPIGPIGPIGPIKPPNGPIVGPIGPIKPPNGPIVGPIKPPIGPIGPIGPICPPGNPPGNPPCDDHPDKCKPWWPPIVLGCSPCNGYYTGGYCPPVYSTPVVVPVENSVVVVGEPAAAPEKLPQVPVGSTLTLQAKELGTTQGQVLLVIDKVTLGVQITEWKTDHTIATLPMLGITAPTKAELVVVKADGAAASSVKVELVAAQSDAAASVTASR